MSAATPGRNSKGPPKPRRDYRGIEAVWSRTHSTWCWRARREWRVAGVRVAKVGPFRTTQLAAHEDYLALGDDSAPRPRGIVTLQQGIDLVRHQDLVEKSLPESTVRCMVDGHGVALTAFWGRDTALDAIDERGVRLYVRQGLSAGRNPNTIRTKDLPLLRRVAKLSERPALVEMISRVREELARSALKPRTPQLTIFRPEEIGALLARMRRRPVLDRQNHHVRRLSDEQATLDADIVQLIATTGIRVLELERTTLADVERGVLRVREAKDRSNPRTIVIGPDLAPVIARLEARARQGLPATTPRAQIPLLRQGRRAVNYACRRWMRILGEPRLSGRTLRHSFVTAVLATGGTSLDAMAAAGHRNLRTTDRYVHALSSRPGERRAAVAAAFGLAADASAASAPPDPAAGPIDQSADVRGTPGRAAP